MRKWVAMTTSQKITIRLSECRQRLNELLGIETRSEEQQAELEKLTGEVQKLEPELRAAIAAEPDPQPQTTDTGDPEVRERLALRARSRFGAYLLAAFQGREVAGAEAEYRSSLKLTGRAAAPGSIPIDLFESDREVRADAATPAPATGTGATLAPVQPFVFAQSIAPLLGIEMPQVGTGAYSEATITTALTAAAKAKGVAQESTAAALTPVTANPRRIAARLTLAVEDVALIGQANFEAALRQNASMALSAEYDDQAINGTGVAPQVTGLIAQLANPTDPGAVADFDAFLAAYADQIDGLWANRTSDVAIVANTDAYRLSAKSFRDAGNNDRGSIAFADYAEEHTGGWWTNARMPDTVATIARGIVHRKGRQGLRTACSPVYAAMTVDDIYTDAASGQRHFTLTMLVGDRVLLVQPGAYGLVEFKVA